MVLKVALAELNLNMNTPNVVNNSRLLVSKTSLILLFFHQWKLFLIMIKLLPSKTTITNCNTHLTRANLFGWTAALKIVTTSYYLTQTKLNRLFNPHQLNCCSWIKSTIAFHLEKCLKIKKHLSNSVSL